jgi:phosphatidate cytidylyltransferase
MSRNLLVRIAFAVPAIAASVVVLWLGGWVLAAFLAVLGVLGARELYDVARRQGIEPLDGLGYAAAALIPFATVWAKGSEERSAEPAIFVGALWVLAVLATALVVRGPDRRPLTAVAVTVFGALYASALLAFAVAIRHGDHSEAHPLQSTALVVMPLALTWICDTCAMAAGTWFGGPRLAPALSPRKTWAGAIGGTAGALAGALLYGPLVLQRVALHLDVWQLATVAAVVAVAAQVGDVAESLFKREARLKDSSSLIPGHGGVLDRLDSLYFVVPVSAGLFKLFGVV